MNRKISISSTHPQGNNGHVVLALSLVMLASVGSYSMYNRGVRESGAQIVSRSLQQISIGDVFAQKVLNRVINILKDTPDGTCYNGDDVPSKLKSYSIEAMQGFGKIDRIAEDHEEKYRLVMMFDEDQNDSDADSSSEESTSEESTTGNNAQDLEGVIDVKLGHVNIIFKNDQDLAECLASDEERRDVDNFYVKINPLHVHEISWMKQVHVEVGGEVKMEQGDRHKSTGFAKSYVLNLQLITLKDLGFVFNNPTNTPLIEIESEGVVELDFKTPVFLYQGKDNNQIQKLSHVISSSGNDGKAWVSPNVVFSRNFYTNAETFDTSEAKSVGNVMVSFTQGIQVKTFKSILGEYPGAFEAYLPPASEAKFSNLVYEKVPHPNEKDCQPLDKSDPDNIAECKCKEDEKDQANCPEKNQANYPDALDFSKNQDIKVKHASATGAGFTSSCHRTYPLVVATTKEVTIDFSEIDSDHPSEEAVFCGLIMADKINVIGLDDEDFDYTMLGTFITKNISIKGKDKTNIIFQNMSSLPARFSDLDFLENLDEENNPYSWYFEREMHDDILTGDDGFKCLNEIFKEGKFNKKTGTECYNNECNKKEDVKCMKAEPKSFFLVR